MEQENKDLFEGISIDPNAKQSLVSMAKWAMIIVVVAVIGYVISIITLFKDDPLAAYRRKEGFESFVNLGGDTTFSVFFSIAIGLLINFFLYRFATLAKSGVMSHNEEKIAGAFKSLKVYFAIMTIILILVFLFVLIVIGAAL